MEVQVISRETIKPSTPTPQHLRHVTLCFLDQKTAPLTVPTLLFYPTPAPQPLSITHLKTCLSLALTSFYPLAGRYQTWGTTLCNDEGVPFIESHVNCPLSDVLTPPYSLAVDFLSLYPPHRDTLQSSGIQMAIQVNVFTCGGFAIGWYHTHKLTDGASAATFLRHWATLVARRYEDAAQNLPDFKAALTAFPPVPGLDQPLKPQQQEEEDNNNNSSSSSSFFQKPILVRSFVFKSGSIDKLKANSVSDEVAKPTRFEAVAGFIWEQILSGSTSKEGKSMLSVVIDLRPRTNPPLPKGAIGNLLETTFVRVDKGAQLPELVMEIHGSVSKMKDIAGEYEGEERAEARERHWKGFIDTFIENRGKEVYILSSWCRSAGFGDIDFGFGKPLWVVPFDSMVKTSNNLRNTIVLTEYTDSEGDGFEAWLFLEEERIKYLESSPTFLAFATPNL